MDSEFITNLIGIVLVFFVGISVGLVISHTFPIWVTNLNIVLAVIGGILAVKRL